MEILENISLKAYTTFKTGGVARYFAEVTSVLDVTTAVNFAKQNSLPWLIIGGGSNLLIDDEGYSGLVILNKLKGHAYAENSDDTVTLVCQSGEVFDDVIKDTVERGFWGLENLSAIPGTFGATPVQNVGAYGVEVSNIIEKVEVYDIEKNIQKILLNNECNFGYRESIFKTENGKKYFIISVHVKLKKQFTPNLEYADLKNKFNNKIPTLKDIRNSIIEIRSAKFPDWKVLGTAGSFFKNPIIAKAESIILLQQYPDLPTYDVGDSLVKIPLGYVLDKICHLKGYRVGDVGLYPAQALVLVNYGEDNSEEIKKFAAKIAEKVFEKTKIEIFPEVSFIEK